MEHWLPLFTERMDTLFDYLADAPIAIEPQGEDAARERFRQIADYYDARREALITRRGARRWSIPAAARSTSLCRPTGFI